MNDKAEEGVLAMGDQTLVMTKVREHSIHALGQAQSRSYLMIYGVLGMSIIGTAIFTYFSLENEQTGLLTPVLLCLMSFAVGVLTLMYGLLKSLSIQAAAHHEALMVVAEAKNLPPRTGTGGIGGSYRRNANPSGRKVSTGRFVIRHSGSSSSTIRKND